MRSIPTPDSSAQSLWLADRLTHSLEVKPGDRVALWLKNCPEFVTTLFGVLHADAALVPINNFLKPDEVNYILGDAGIDVLITDETLAKHELALLAARPGLRILRVEDFASLPEVAEVAARRLPANRERPGGYHLHVRDDGPAERRDAVARQPALQCRELSPGAGNGGPGPVRDRAADVSQLHAVRGHLAAAPDRLFGW